MTEEEAKTKWCPHAVASHTDPRAQTGYARPELGLPADTFLHCCIGSACMAWRVRHMTQDERRAMHNEQLKLGQLPEEAWAFVNRADLGDGYCGLAGPIQ